MDGAVLEEKLSFKMLTFSSKLDWVLTSVLLNCFEENWSLDSFYEVSFF